MEQFAHESNSCNVTFTAYLRGFWLLLWSADEKLSSQSQKCRPRACAGGYSLPSARCTRSSTLAFSSSISSCDPTACSSSSTVLLKELLCVELLLDELDSSASFSSLLLPLSLPELLSSSSVLARFSGGAGRASRPAAGAGSGKTAWALVKGWSLSWRSPRGSGGLHQRLQTFANECVGCWLHVCTQCLPRTCAKAAGRRRLSMKVLRALEGRFGLMISDGAGTVVLPIMLHTATWDSYALQPL